MQLQEEQNGIRSHKILEHPEPPPHRGLLGLPAPSTARHLLRLRGRPVRARRRTRVPVRVGRRRGPGADPTSAPYHALGPRPAGGAGGARAVHRPRDRAPSERPGHARVPLRGIRACDAAPPDPAARHARRGAGHPAARGRLRRPLPRRATGRPRPRSRTRSSGWRSSTNWPATRTGSRRRSRPCWRTSDGWRPATKRSSTACATTTVTTAYRPSCSATGWKSDGRSWS